MKLKNMQNEIEAKSHEGAKVIITRHRKSKSRKGVGSRDMLDNVIINVSIAIGILMVVMGVNMVAGGYLAEIPSMLGLG
ncbi:MAG: hypothetical protein R3Y32_00470 [Bacillota bacterium]